MKFTPQGIEILVSSRRRWKKKLKGGRLGIEGDAEEWKEIRFNDRTSGKGRIEKSCRRPRRIGADERKEFGEWECHDLFFHYNGNGVRDGEGWIETDFGCTHRRGISTDHRDRDILPRWSRGIYSTRWKFRNPSRAGFFSRNLSNWIRIFLPSWHTCEYAYAWKFDSCSSYYFPPSPQESSPFRSLIRKRVAWKVVRSIDSSRREKKKTIYRSKIIIYSAFVKFVLSLTSHGAFCINKIPISTKMPCVSRLATLRGKK